MHLIALRPMREAGVARPADLLQRLQVLALNRDQWRPKERYLTGLAPANLFLFRADSADALDGKRRAAGSRGDLTILFEDVAVCGLVTIQPRRAVPRARAGWNAATHPHRRR